MMKPDLTRDIYESRNYPGTYIVTVSHATFGEILYHVIPGEPLWPEVSAYVAAHPECVQKEPEPEPMKIDPEVQLRMEIDAEIAEEARAVKMKDPKWQARRAELEKQL